MPFECDVEKVSCSILYTRRVVRGDSRLMFRVRFLFRVLVYPHNVQTRYTTIIIYNIKIRAASITPLARSLVIILYTHNNNITVIARHFGSGRHKRVRVIVVYQ